MLFSARVCAIREPKNRAVAAADQEDALARLGHAVVCGVQDSALDRIVRPRLFVYLTDTAKQQLESLRLTFVGEAVNVLEQKRPRACVAKDSQVGGERVCTRIIE